jgi:flagellar basal body rod protein FlgF
MPCIAYENHILGEKMMKKERTRTTENIGRLMIVQLYLQHLNKENNTLCMLTTCQEALNT